MSSFREWRKSSRRQQEQLSNLLSDRIWDEFKHPQEDRYLFKKLAIALFGTPDDSSDLRLTREEKDVVNDIKNKCLHHNYSSSRIWIAVIYAFITLQDDTIQICVPIIRVRSCSSKNLADVPDNTYIDHLGRVYKSWERYKDNNMWRKAWLCVPEDGYYSSEYDDVCFLDQSDRGTVWEVTDNVASAAALASSAGMITGMALTFFPPTAVVGAALCLSSAVVDAPATAYGVGRSAGHLVDRYSHEQSVSLSDREARQYWLTAAGGVITVGSVATARTLARAARSGGVMSSTTRAGCTAVRLAGLSLSYVSLINAVCELQGRRRVRPVDVYRLSTQIFFFTHSVVSFQTASDIIRDVQEEHIAQSRGNLSQRERRAFDGMLQDARVREGRVRRMHGNARFIRRLNRIDSADEFFGQMEID